MRVPLIFISTVIFIYCGLFAAAAAANNNIIDILATTNYEHYRLPTAVRPQKYQLKVITHLEDEENLFFNGEVEILLDVIADVADNITLHVNNLTIDDTKIKLKNLQNKAAPNCVKSIAVNAEHDYYIMNLCEKILKDETYILTIPFSGILKDDLKGYYKSSYHDKATNETRWLAVTQFEPSDARAAFPCFDEPDMKAKFTIILGHHKKYTALSNMPLKETKPMTELTDWVWSEFEESVAMSTYIVAYTVNDFAYEKAETNLKNNVQFRTWARRDAIDQCHYAGVVGPQVLQYYEDIFDIKFPLEKIDQMAVPDFGAGAMENWGLVTYREITLLYAPNVSSQANKQRVASVIAHELAHQWFGNLVTMKWWTDLWLNEGFATYIASLGIQHISPEWKSLEEQSIEYALSIFRTDALKSSHPISQPIRHVNEISENFDKISYRKGSTVLRMMHQFLGDDSFHSGLHDYLEKYAYKNAEQDDLWAALTGSALKHRSIPNNYNIKKIMDSWTLQTGYPVLTVTRNYDTNSALITQERYLLDSEALRSNYNNCWWVPLSYTTQYMSNFSSVAPQDWLECDESNNKVEKTLQNMPSKQEWIIFNIQMSGLYKVKYDDHNWNMLIETLTSDDFTNIHVINRALLIEDALSLAWSGYQDYDVAMRLIEYLVQEKEYIPWMVALDNLGYINRILKQTPNYEFFKEYMQKILTPIYLHLEGLNSTEKFANDHTAITHKVLIASWACRFEVADCIPRAQLLFSEWRTLSSPDQNNPIPIDLRSTIYCTALRHGTDEEWKFLWDRYRNSNVASEKRTIIFALGCTREIWLLQRYLEWAFDESSHIRKQDTDFAFSSVVQGEVGFHLAKDYFLSNIEFINNYFKQSSKDFARLFVSLGNGMVNLRDYEDMKNFTEQNRKLFTKSEQTILRTLETIQNNAQWKQRHYNEIGNRLKARLVKI